MKNIFKNSYFGKPYKTKDGRKALYKYCSTNSTRTSYYLTIKNFENDLEYTSDGQSLYNDNLTVISEWHEEINKEELDKLAIESYKEPGYIGEDPLKWYTEGFKAGYNKAMEYLIK